MMNPPTGSRRFKGGAWDLRKAADRRKQQLAIAFPDRRVNDRRRGGGGEDDFSAATTLTWIAPSDPDE
jgi:hypothetical protein